jgi:DNA-directed RNA polymerase sigma subunit (sigma70/sigma32)
MSQRFGLDGARSRTLQAIGDDFGVTKARIQQIEVRLIRKISRALEKERHENRVGTPA